MFFCTLKKYTNTYGWFFEFLIQFYNCIFEFNIKALRVFVVVFEMILLALTALSKEISDIRRMSNNKSIRRKPDGKVHKSKTRQLAGPIHMYSRNHHFQDYSSFDLSEVDGILSFNRLHVKRDKPPGYYCLTCAAGLVKFLKLISAENNIAHMNAASFLMPASHKNL